MKAFKAYDIRGIYDTDFNKEDAYRTGFYLPRLMQAQRVLVGRDMRNSSPEIFEALAAGITDAGSDVYDAGITTTPMIYYLTASQGFDASVMITASHNAAHYNGMKISGTDAVPVGYDTGLGELEQMIREEPRPVSEKGKIIAFEKKEDYLSFLKKYKQDYSALKIAVDCSNGVAALFVKELFGHDITFLNHEMDGNFPGHPPNPLEEENLKQLQEVVLREKADLGIIFDGDADRVMFVDEKAQFIRPDLMIALLGDYFLPGNPGAKVLHDIRSSRVVSRHLASLGAEVHMWRVGRAYAARKLKEINGIFGGELAGHYYFRDFFYSDSGLLPALIILNTLLKIRQEGNIISDYFNSINDMHNSGEINFRIENKKAAMEEIVAHFSKHENPEKKFNFDGYRLDFNDWWFNIRPSNTEPYLRFIAEAASADKLEAVTGQTREIISRYE